MSTPRTALAQRTQIHRNLKSLATVATPATALHGGAFSCCRLVKEVATGGNTNPFLNISATTYRALWLLLLPVKKHRQRFGNILHLWRPRNPGLLPLLPLLPVFLKPEEHVYECLAGGCAQ